ncbi:Calx-beta domain-containing protein [Candidatus Poriferisocius sp.]|uniref:Calx-beta domain-containing protein n=1 Tax=Candidatus Poriferisocius sp. TaxID=3101276 RepID=UPI003B01667A
MRLVVVVGLVGSLLVGVSGAAEAQVVSAPTLLRDEIEEGETRHFLIAGVPRGYSRYFVQFKPLDGYTATADDVKFQARTDYFVSPGQSGRVGPVFGRNGGSGTVRFRVEAVDDGVVDPDETFGLRLCSAFNCSSGAVLGDWTVTIRERAADATLSGTGVSVLVSGGSTSMLERSVSGDGLDTRDSVTITVASAPSSDIVVVGEVAQRAPVAVAGGGTGMFPVAWVASEGAVFTTGDTYPASVELEISARDNTVDTAGGSLSGTVTWTVLEYNAAFIDKAAGSPTTPYTGISVPDVAFTVTDDDPTSVEVLALATPDASATEGDSSDTAGFRLRLGRALVAGESLTVPVQPIGGVLGADFSLALSGSPQGVSYAAAASGFGEVTFTGPSAREAALVVGALADADEVSESVLFLVAHRSNEAGPRFLRAGDLAGGACSGIRCPHHDTLAAEYRVRLWDTSPGLRIAATDGAEVAENGGELSYEVSLAAAPEAGETVTVAVSSGNTSALTVTAGASLSFTAADWSTPQQITVQGVNDTTDTANRQVTVAHAVSNNGGTSYSTASDRDVVVRVVDDDATTITLSGGGTLEEAPLGTGWIPAPSEVMVEGDASRADVLMVSLGRELVAGEFVRVPLVVEALENGSRVAQLSGREPRTSANVAWPPRFNDVTMAASGVGVSFEHVDARTPPGTGYRVVTFAGAGAQTATVRLAARGGFDDGETADDDLLFSIYPLNLESDPHEALLAQLAGGDTSNLGGGLMEWQPRAVGAAYRMFRITDDDDPVVGADWPLLPDGVGPGDKFRLIYVTSATTAADRPDAAFYDQFARDEITGNTLRHGGVAALAPYAAEFKAVISAKGAGETVPLDGAAGHARFGAAVTSSSSDYNDVNAAVYWVNGAKVADTTVGSGSDFTDGTWDDETNPKYADGRAATASTTGYWTGSAQNGTAPPPCSAAGRPNRLVAGEEWVAVGKLNDSSSAPLGSATTAGTTLTDPACTGERGALPDGSTETQPLKPLYALSTAFTVEAGVTVEPASAQEGQNINFTVRLPADAASAVTVPYTLSDGRGVSPDPAYSVATGSADGTSADYNNTSGTITIATGDRTGTITVATTQDDVYEGDHYLTVTLRTPTGTDAPALSASRASAVGTITDGADVPSIGALGQSAVIVDENVGTHTVTLRKTGATLVPASVTWYTISGTAIAGEDFVGAEQTVTFGPSETDKTVTVTIIDDEIPELTENLQVARFTNFVDAKLASGVSGVVSVQVLSIRPNDPPTVSIAAANPSELEGDSAEFTVTASAAPAYDMLVSVQVAETGGGDHVAAADETTHTVTIEQGEMSAEFFVDTQNDDVQEPDTQLAVTVQPASAAQYTLHSTHTATITIQDNDEPASVTVALSAPAGDVVENGGTKDVTVTLGRAPTGTETVTVPLTVAGATVTGDFTLGLHPPSQTGVTLMTAGSHSAQNPAVSFAAGASSAVLRFTAVTNTDRTQPAISVAYGTSSRAPAAGGGAVLGALSGSPITFVITDDETGTLEVPSDWALKPTGLAAGASFRLMFVTSATRTAAPTDIEVYNDWVQELVARRSPAAFKPYGGLVKIIGSTATVDARDNTDSNVNSDGAGEPIYWLDAAGAGAKLADDYAGFYGGSWSNVGTANIRSENGTLETRNNDGYLTGSRDEGTAYPNSPLGGSASIRISRLHGNLGLDNGRSTSPTNSRPFYALSPVFQVAQQATRAVELRDSSDALLGHTTILNKGETLSFKVALVSGTGPVTVTLDYTGGGTAVRNTHFTGPLTVTIPAGQSEADVAIVTLSSAPPSDNKVLAITPSVPAGFTVRPARHDVIIRDLSVKVMLERDDDAADEASVLEAATAAEKYREAVFEVKLSRALKMGERVDAPLVVSGSGVSTSDYTLSLASGDGVNTGVSLEDGGTLTPTVIFQGVGARTATLVLTAVADGVDEVAETATVALGNRAAFEADTDTNVDAGAAPVLATSSASVGIVSSEDTPVLSVAAESASVVVGDAAVFVVSASPMPAADLAVVLGVAETGGHVQSRRTGDKTVTISGGSGTARHSVGTLVATNLAQGSVSATVQPGAYAIGSPNTASVALTPEIDATISKAAAVTVGEASGHQDVEIALGRALASNETITVSLSVTGAVAGEDFTLALQPLTQTGVTLLTSGMHSVQNPAVRFAAGARTATVRFSPVDNDVRSQPYVTITVTDGVASGGVAFGEAHGGAVRFVVVDDEAGDVVVPADWPLAPSGLSGGDSFRLLFVTSQTRNAASATIGEYDLFAQALVSAGHTAVVPYAGLFKVVGSTPTVDARDHTATTFTPADKGDPVYWLAPTANTAKAADDYEDFYDGGWANENAPRDESSAAATISTGGYFTGSDTDGTAASGAELGAAGAANAGVRIGKLNDSGAGVGPLSAATQTVAKNSARPLYALSPVFTVSPGPEISIAAGTSPVTEGTPASFTVMADSAPGANLTINLSVAETSTGGGDFVATGDEGSGKSVTILAGQTTATFTVATTQDTVDEPDGGVSVTVEAGSGYTLSASDSSDSVVVSDNDSFSLTLSRDAGASIDEGASTGYTLTFSRALGAGQSVTKMLTTGGTATWWNDYRLVCPDPAPSGVVCSMTQGARLVQFSSSFAGTSLALTLTAQHDADADDAETVDLGLSAAGYGGTYADGTPRDIDNAGSLTINDAVGVTLSAPLGDVAEASGTKDVTVTLSRALSGSEVVIVPLSVSGATVTDDFTFGLQPATQTGVTLVTAGSHSAQNPAVRLAAGASSAVLRFTAVANSVRTQPYVTIAYGSAGRVPTGTGVTLGEPAGGPVSFVITDDETGDIVVPGDWPLLPMAVSAGGDFRVLFATSGTRDATSADIGDYDDFVRSHAAMGHADVVPYAGFFRVLASTAAVDARDHNDANPFSDGPGEPTYWLRPTTSTVHQVGGNYTNLLDGAWENEGGVTDESGAAATVNAVGYWTGTFDDGTGFTGRELGAGSGSSTVGIGKLDSGTAGENPFRGGILARTTELPFYALSPTFTAGAAVVAAGVSISETSGSTSVTEAAGGRTDTYTVVLDSAPTHAVMVTATSATPAAATVSIGGGTPGSSATLTFSTSNWNMAQTVTVHGVDDSADQGASRMVVISHAATSTDTDYVIADAGSVTVTVVDDDATVVSLGVSSSSVAEGASVSVSVSLSSAAPTGGVSVPVRRRAAGSTAEAADYTLAASVSVTAGTSSGSATLMAVNDSIDEGASETLVIELGALPSGYAEGTTSHQTITITDNDSAGVTISESSGSTSVTEASGGPNSDTYTVVLDTQPTHEVTVTVTAGAGVLVDGPDPGSTGTRVETLTFSTSNWNSAQTVTVYGDDDNIDQAATRTVTITHAASSTDTNYGSSQNIADVDVTVTDNDSAGVSISESSGSTSVTEASGGPNTDTYTVVLDTQPTHSVMVTATSGTPAAATVSTGGGSAGASVTLTFSTSNWNSAQTVTVHGVDDSDDQGASRMVAISHAATSTDTNYVIADAGSVDVTVVDDDDPAPSDVAVSLGVSATSVAEGASIMVSVTLASPAPVGGVVIPVQRRATGSTAGTGDYTLAASVSVAATMSSGSATLAATDDDIDEGASETLIIELGALPTGYAEGTTAHQTITITDNDSAGVTITETSGSTSVTEASGGPNTDTYTVVLDSQPTHSVMVTATSGTPAAATVSTGGGSAGASVTLTFSTSNWDMAQTVTVHGVDDSDDQGASRMVVISHAATSTDTNYVIADAGSVDVTVVDDDDPAPSDVAVSLGVSATSVAEGASIMVSVTLASPAPVGGVVIPVQRRATGSTAGTGDYTLAASVSVAATMSSGSATLMAVNDSIDEGASETLIIELGALPPGYAEGTTAHQTITITDNDSAGVSISESSGSTSVTEASGGPNSDTYTVVLDTQPTHEVTVTVTAGAGVLVDGPDPGSTGTRVETLTFSTSNWNSAQTVTVYGDDDSIDQAATRTVTITHAASSTDTNYGSSQNIADVDVTVTDNDSAGVTITETSGSTSVTEASGGPNTDTYTVVLDTQPTHAVMVTATSATPAAATVSTGGGTAGASVTLTFSTSNWNSAQTVTVHGVDDSADQGASRMVAISHAATSTDTNYVIADAGSVDVTVVDDDATVVTLGVSSSSVAEGASVSVSVSLSSAAPTGGVSVPVQRRTTGSTAGTGDYTLAASVAVAAGTSSGSATLMAVNDSIDEGVSETLVIELGTLPTGYVAGTTAHQTITITDNDSAGVTITQSGGSTAVTEAAGGRTDTYTVVLDSQPTHAVMVTVTSGTPAAARVHGPGGTPGASATLTFSTSNWSTAQTVTVTGVDDSIDQGASRMVTITHAASSTDTDYTIADAGSVTVTVTDNDSVGVTITQSSGSTAVTEAAGGRTDTYSVVLDSQPTHPVMVTVTSGTPAAARVHGPGGTPGASATLTFSTSNWSTAQTVTVTGVDDSIDQGASRMVVISHAASSTDTDYAIADAGSVSVTVTDNDSAGVTITQSGGSTAVTEAAGGTNTDTYTVVLDSQPTHPVMVTATSDTPGAATVSAPGGAAGASATLTFSTSNWNSAQTVTVFGVDDAVDQVVPRSVVISHAATSTDTDYTIADAGSVVVTVADDDSTVVSLGVSSSSVAEGASVTLSVFLSAAAPPGGAVVPVQRRALGSTAVAADYSLAASVSVAAGAVSGSATLAATDDSIDEGASETLIIELGALPAGFVAGVPASVAVTIVDDDDPPVVVPGGAVPMVGVAGGPWVEEGEAAVFTLTASPLPTAPVVVTVNVVEQGSYLLGAQGPHKVTVGVSGTATLSVDTVDDSVDEGDGTIRAVVVDGPGYEADSDASQALVVVSDNDDFPTVAPISVVFDVVDSALVEGDSADSGSVELKLSRSLAAGETLNVDLDRTNVDAGVWAFALAGSPAGVSYDASAARLTFAGPSAPRAATVTVTAAAGSVDGSAGGARAVPFAVASVSGVVGAQGQIGDEHAQTLHITDSAATGPVLDLSAHANQDRIVEGGVLAFSFTLSEKRTAPTVVRFEVAGWGQYPTQPGDLGDPWPAKWIAADSQWELVIAAGSLWTGGTLRVLDDQVPDGDKMFAVRIASVSAGVRVGRAERVIIARDTLPNPEIVMRYRAVFDNDDLTAATHPDCAGDDTATTEAAYTVRLNKQPEPGRTVYIDIFDRADLTRKQIKAITDDLGHSAFNFNAPHNAATVDDNWTNSLRLWFYNDDWDQPQTVTVEVACAAAQAASAQIWHRTQAHPTPRDPLVYRQILIEHPEHGWVRAAQQIPPPITHQPVTITATS